MTDKAMTPPVDLRDEAVEEVAREHEGVAWNSRNEERLHAELAKNDYDEHAVAARDAASMAKFSDATAATLRAFSSDRTTTHARLREVEAEGVKKDAELRIIDAVLARRPALDALPNRAAKIERAIRVAATADVAEAAVIDRSQHIVLLLAAMRELLAGHDNLYVAHFGTSPLNDIAAKAARTALATATPAEVRGETG